MKYQKRRQTMNDTPKEVRKLKKGERFPDLPLSNYEFEHKFFNPSCRWDKLVRRPEFKMHHEAFFVSRYYNVFSYVCFFCKYTSHKIYERDEI
jgi:hypothetical protein